VPSKGRRSRRTRAATPEHASVATLDLAMRGLINLGFARADAQRAIDGVSRRHANDAAPPAVQQLLREALAALT
jgi:Holliday junction resolvasome RuvABC DNA-binding subunit